MKIQAPKLILYQLTNKQGHIYCLSILVSLMLMLWEESGDAFGPFKVMIGANASDLFIHTLSLHTPSIHHYKIQYGAMTFPK